MKVLLFALLAVSCAAAPRRNPASVMVTKYCDLGKSTPRFLSDSEVARVYDEDKNGKLMAEHFQAAWTQSCDFDVSFEIAEGAKAGKLYVGQFLDFVYPNWSSSCSAIRRTIEPKAARDIAFAIGGHEADAGAIREAWKTYCDASFALQIGRDVKGQKLDLAIFKRVAVGEVCLSRHLALTPEQVRDIAYGVKDGKFKAEEFLRVWRDNCDFGETWAQLSPAD